MKISFSVFLFLIVLISSAQENKSLKGQFIGENLEKSFINVININQAKATISKLDGKFEIQAKVGDSILISSIQYKEMKFVVIQEYFEESIEIKMTYKINQLNQVNLYSYGLTGNIEKDIENIKVFDFSPKDLGFPATVTFDSGLKDRYSGNDRNTDLIYNAINKSLKIQGNLSDEEFLKIKMVKFGLSIPDDFLEDDLRIPENMIEDFKYYCIERFPVVNLFIHNNELLKLYEALPRIAKKYYDFRNINKN